MAQKCLSDDTPALYLDGEMEKVAAEVVYQHLVICDSCCKRRDEFVLINKIMVKFLEREKFAKSAEKATLGPVVDTPTAEQLQEWLSDVTCPATDGCIVEHEGTCPHGHHSWLKHLGLI